MTTTSDTNVNSDTALSQDIEAIDLASQASGGNGTVYTITLAPGATLPESADLDAEVVRIASSYSIHFLPLPA